MSKKIKLLLEQRGSLAAEMQEILTAAKGETRAFTEEETEKLNQLEKAITAIDDTIRIEKRANELLAYNAEQKKTEGSNEDVVKAEERAFISYVISQAGGSVPEQRADGHNVTMGENGAIIPTSIAKRIITKVNEMCPIHSHAARFEVKGTLKVPVYGATDDGHDITVGYQEEFDEITESAGKFSSVDLTGYLSGALAIIGKSVINNSEIDVLDFIENEIAKRIALFLEKEELLGTEDKATGALSTENVLKAESVSAITADKLIELQAKIPTVYQTNACWTMHPDTFTALKKLKDTTGQYLLQFNSGIANGFPAVILGKPVFVSGSMPKIGEGAKPVLYGDYSGLGVNMRKQIDIQVLTEKYATKHAVGIVAWFEFDSKVIDHQKLAALEMSVTA